MTNPSNIVQQQNDAVSSPHGNVSLFMLVFLTQCE